MSKLEKIRDQLSAYIDGELTSAQARRVEEAVVADAELADELAGLRAVRELVGSLPASRAPGDLLDSIMQQAERGRLVDSSPQESSPSHGAWRWVRRLAVAAVLAISACIGVAIVSQVWNAGPEQIPLARHDDNESIAPIARGGAKGGGGGYDKNVGNEGKFSGARAYRRAGKGYVRDALGTLLASAAVDIYTPDMLDTQDRVERVLGRNSIGPAVLNVDGSITRTVRHKGKGKSRARAAFSHAKQISTTQVQYEIYATQEQIDNIRKELGPVIAMQKVSQTRIADAPYKYAISNGSAIHQGRLRKPMSPKGGRLGRRDSLRRGETVAAEAVHVGQARKKTEGLGKSADGIGMMDRTGKDKAGLDIVSKAEAGEAESRPAGAAAEASLPKQLAGQTKEDVTEERDLDSLGLVARSSRSAASPSPVVPGAAGPNGRDSKLMDANGKAAPSVEGKNDDRKDLPKSRPTGLRDESSLFARLLRELGVIEADGHEDMAEGTSAASRPVADGKRMDQRLQARAGEKIQPAQRHEAAGRSAAGLRQGQAGNIWAQKMQIEAASQAVANVRRLVITLNYRQPRGDAHMMRLKALPPSQVSKPQESQTKAQK